MKELTVEQKAKRYDEAIKRAEEYYKEGKTLEYADNLVSGIFPELAESDDERIRKELLEHCKNQAEPYIQTGNKCPQIQSWIAWLEKQGEQKLIDKIQLGKKYKCIASPRYSTFMKGFIYIPQDKFLCSLMNFCSDCFELIEDGEQKPNPVLDIEIPFGAKDSELQESSYYIPEGFHAEIDDNKVVIKKGEKSIAWSEEDEKIVLSIEQVMNCASLLNMVPEKESKIRTWLKSIKDRVLPQKQEWSKEGKARIDRIIDVLDWAEDKGRISYSDWEDYVAYVRCLRPQPNTKWCKLDDIIQKKIINYFECQREIEPTRKDILNTWINWLKSLRPQNTWKPSDEQMKVLEELVEDNNQRYFYTTLKSLYEQLKKM